MQILVFNCGSSSLKADVVEVASGSRVLSFRAEKLNTSAAAYTFSTGESGALGQVSLAERLDAAFQLIFDRCADLPVQAIGHRVAHGANRYARATLITPEVESDILELGSLAPLHNPPISQGIRLARALWQHLPHVAVFDTAFHSTLPDRAIQYALPHALAERHGIRRYGFHGTSHQYVAERVAKSLQLPLDELRIISCHLGNGASVCAVEYGRSVETSMGMTPLEGLVMGTRSGDLDAGALLHLMEREGLTTAQASELLNQNAGLLGLTNGAASDFRELEARSEAGDALCRRAIQVFTHRVRKYIGAFAAVMNGVDIIVFTAGIGENSAMARHRISQRLDFLGAILDEDANRCIKLTDDAPVAFFHQPQSRCRLAAVRTDECHAIACQTAEALKLHHRNQTLDTQTPVPIAVSARHVHLTQEAVEALFGPGHQLTPYKPLSQPGQYACVETVTLVGPKNNIANVRILGPVRTKNQVEISRTDEFTLGIDAPVRESGQTDNSPPITLVGPAGTLHLPDGLICAWRHIHMSPDDARHFGVEDRDIVDVAVSNGTKGLTFGNVLIRVHPDFRLEMHIDTDEGNAAEIGTVNGQPATGTLVRRYPKPGRTA